MANFYKYLKSLPFLSLRILNYHEKFVYKFMTISKIFLIMITLILSVDGYGQSITWQKIYNSCNSDVAYDIKQLDENTFFVVGIGSYGLQCRPLNFIKFNKYGDTLLTKTLDTLPSKLIEITNNGCVIVGNSFQPSVCKLDFDGNLVWYKKFDGYLTQYNDLKRTNDGGFIFCGSESYQNGIITRIDSVGNLKWNLIFPSTGFMVFTSVIEDNNSYFILTGNITYENPNNDFRRSDSNSAIITKIDLNGNIIWNKKFYINGKSAVGKEIDILNQSYIIGGYLYLFDSLNLPRTSSFISLFDINGNQSYYRQYDTLTSEYLYSMKKLNNNKFVIAINRDSTHDTVSYGNLKILIIDSLGNILKDNTFPGNKYIWINSLQPIVNGDIIFAGYMGYGFGSNNKEDIYLIRTDSNLNAPPIGLKKINDVIPAKFKLYNIYPNPFNPVANIKFDLKESGLVKIVIYNSLGQELKILYNDELQRGSYLLKWNAGSFASGIYYCTFYFDNTILESKKLILIK